MQLIDPNHPAYRRLWVRIAIVAVCFAWATVEFVTGDPFWGVISGAPALCPLCIVLDVRSETVGDRCNRHTR